MKASPAFGRRRFETKTTILFLLFFAVVLSSKSFFGMKLVLDEIVLG